MSQTPWMLGASAVAAYWWTRNHKSSAAMLSTPLIGTLPGRWVWPVPMWEGRAPVISDGFGSPRLDRRRHKGVDIMFKRVASDAFKTATPNASREFVMPDGIVAVAASDGVIRSAMRTARGFAVVIDHKPRAFTTFYTHLERLLVPQTGPNQHQQAVRAGQPIGVIGFDPLDPAKLKHLHFELWRGGPSTAVDPAIVMRSWETVKVPAATAGARNASLTYRAIGGSREPYPQWVRDLKDTSGVYVIRDADTSEILYVGSSRGRLYDTLTRHFQIWRRWKGFWKGQYGEGHDPGLTYKRDRVEVAVRLTRESEALDEEARLIQRLRPRDNLIGQASEDEVPF